MVLTLKAHITSYLYNGPHRYYQPGTRSFDKTRPHYDWRYRITCNGLTIYTRSGFCTYAAALTSLRKNWPRIEGILRQQQQQQQQ